MVDNVVKSGHERRWLQFSMRTMLMFMLLCGLAVGCWSVYVQPYRNQANAVAAVTNCGGKLRIRTASGPALQRWLVTTVVGEKGFFEVISVDLSDTSANNSTLKQVRAMPALEELTLDRCTVSDEGIAELSNLRRLKRVSLRYTGLGDGGLRAFRDMPQLQELRVTGTSVTDNGLRILRGLESLTTLYARWTLVTTGGAAEFEQAVPGCQVHYHTLVSSIVE